MDTSGSLGDRTARNSRGRRTAERRGGRGFGKRRVRQRQTDSMRDRDRVPRGLRDACTDGLTIVRHIFRTRSTTPRGNARRSLGAIGATPLQQLRRATGSAVPLRQASSTAYTTRARASSSASRDICQRRWRLFPGRSGSGPRCSADASSHGAVLEANVACDHPRRRGPEALRYGEVQRRRRQDWKLHAVGRSRCGLERGYDVMSEFGS